MVELFEQQLKNEDRHSSKGNQLKWIDKDIWYKADYMGYEGLAEFVTSHLLQYSTLEAEEYVLYELEEIQYKNNIFHGVKSMDLLETGWQIITLERLFKNLNGQSLSISIWKISDVKERLRFLVNQVERYTGIRNFGIYLAKLFTLDAFFLNEDRHMHNIAILMNEIGEYKLCPIFDHGASLLSDTKLDYPMEADVFSLIPEVHGKSISRDFDEQLFSAEELYGDTIHFSFKRKDIDKIVDEANSYTSAERERVRTILNQQMRKYAYLFI